MEVSSHVRVLMLELKRPVPHVPMGPVDDAFKLVRVYSGGFPAPVQAVGLSPGLPRKPLKSVHNKVVINYVIVELKLNAGRFMQRAHCYNEYVCTE